MDGLSLSAVVRELQFLVGAKVEKIQQPERDILLLTLRIDRENYRLLLSSNAETGRIQLTAKSFDNPVVAPPFCMYLRRHVQGSRVTAISQRGVDRVFSMTFMGKDDLGDSRECTLVVELMGKYSNIIAIQQDGTIGECIRHVDPSMSQVRHLMPGLPFVEAPSQGKSNPFTMTYEEFGSCFSPVEKPADTLVRCFEGFSKNAAKSIYDPSAAFSPVQVLESLFSLRDGNAVPCIVNNLLEEPLYLLPFSPVASGLSYTVYPSMSDALDAFYRRKEASQIILRHSQQLRRILENALSKASKKLGMYEEAMSADDKLASYRLSGELITANLYRMKKGSSILEAENYYMDPPSAITIPLDVTLSPIENAQRYYKLYKKGCAARDYALEETEKVETEIRYLQEQLENLNKCETIAELMEVKEELIRDHILSPEKKGAKQRFPRSLPMRYSIGNTEILVGKNNRQNDEITINASGDQLWLHVRNAPGSHVIVCKTGMPDDEVLLAAGQLAAYYSSQKNGSNVPVDYTFRKFVKKPSGAKGGFVIYTTNKTLYVTPDHAFIHNLERKDTIK